VYRLLNPLGLRRRYANIALTGTGLQVRNAIGMPRRRPIGGSIMVSAIIVRTMMIFGVGHAARQAVVR
jgi:hypothetical protein